MVEVIGLEPMTLCL